ncbi:hypothetical protein HY522_08235, partial [bacterium]|nr:hypothetical protein [bacterium]
MDGLKKLGSDNAKEPPAVVAAKYHHLSNEMGGLDMEYVEESPKKVWIRYLAPAWGYDGCALFVVPASVQRATFAAWHGRNAVFLNCPRLRFVLTKTLQDGEPYAEGYFEECDWELRPEERFQYQPVATSPDCDPARQPTLDPAVWPQARRDKA